MSPLPGLSLGVALTPDWRPGLTYIAPSGLGVGFDATGRLRMRGGMVLRRRVHSADIAAGENSDMHPGKRWVAKKRLRRGYGVLG